MLFAEHDTNFGVEYCSRSFRFYEHFSFNAAIKSPRLHGRMRHISAMKPLLVVSVVIFSVRGQNEDPNAPMVLNVNDVADKSIKTICDIILRKNMDPLPLPDMFSGFSHKFFLVTYQGGVNLTEGWLSGISTMRREGEVVVNVGTVIVLTADVGFDLLKFNYHYMATIMNLGPSGSASGSVSGFKLRAVIQIDISGNTPSVRLYSLQDFQAGRIGIQFDGGMLSTMDWLLNMASNTIITLLQYRLLQIVQEQVYAQADGYLKVVNDYFKTHSEMVTDMVMQAIGNLK